MNQFDLRRNQALQQAIIKAFNANAFKGSNFADVVKFAHGTLAPFFPQARLSNFNETEVDRQLHNELNDMKSPLFKPVWDALYANLEEQRNRTAAPSPEPSPPPPTPAPKPAPPPSPQTKSYEFEGRTYEFVPGSTKNPGTIALMIAMWPSAYTDFDVAKVLGFTNSNGSGNRNEINRFALALKLGPKPRIVPPQRVRFLNKDYEIIPGTWKMLSSVDLLKAAWPTNTSVNDIAKLLGFFSSNGAGATSFINRKAKELGLGVKPIPTILVSYKGTEYTIVPGRWNNQDGRTERLLRVMWENDELEEHIARTLGFLTIGGSGNPHPVRSKAVSMGLIGRVPSDPPPPPADKGRAPIPEAATKGEPSVSKPRAIGWDSPLAPTELDAIFDEPKPRRRGVMIDGVYKRIEPCQFAASGDEICGQDSEPGSNYCPYHCRILYAPKP
jgi:hypothetical protein